jgi:hypothetical protein
MRKRFSIGFGIWPLIFLTINLLMAHLSSSCGPRPFSDETLPGTAGDYYTTPQNKMIVLK